MNMKGKAAEHISESAIWPFQLYNRTIHHQHNSWINGFDGMKAKRKFLRTDENICEDFLNSRINRVIDYMYVCVYTPYLQCKML